MDDQSVLTYPQQAMTPLTPLEPGVEMFERGKTQSFFSNVLTVRSSLERPLSHLSVAYTDIEDDSSEFEEFGGSSVCYLFYSSMSMLTVYRVTTGEVRLQYRHSKKYRHHQARNHDSNSPNGTFPSL
jgi:hypothetical protein